MTKLLKEAFEKATKLPDQEQDSIAVHIILEVDSRNQWDQTLASTQDQLEAMATEAVEEHEKGKTTPADDYFLKA